MNDLLQEYKNRKPQIVFEWNDNETGAQGWVVINSLRGGAAGGGTRMRLGLDKSEVESLAKVMEIKFTVSGPPIGGAKSGINFDPFDPRKDEVLKRWYKAVSPLLKSYYGTGGDLNIDEVKDVIPITEQFGIWHPQEGVVNGHFNALESHKIKKIGNLRLGVSMKVESEKYTPDATKDYLVADLITGFGVSESVKHYYQIYRSQNLEGKRVLVQGFGNVAGAAAYYLAQSGAKIVGILDKESGLLSDSGFGTEEIKKLLSERKGNQLYHPDMKSFNEINDQFWKTEADIFIPAAASKLVSKAQIESLIDSGLKVVSSGANVPFKDSDIFFGEVAEFVDNKIALIPDFIANCGMARTFAYLMDDNAVVEDEKIFQDVSLIIDQALTQCHNISTQTFGISKIALEIALKKLIN